MSWHRVSRYHTIIVSTRISGHYVPLFLVVFLKILLYTHKDRMLLHKNRFISHTAQFKIIKTNKASQNVENKCKHKNRRKSCKVRPIVNLCRIITRRQLIIPAPVGTQTRTRLKKVNKPKISRPKLPRGRKTADNTPRRILTTNLIQVKVTPFLTANLITKSIENSNLPGLKMRKKRDKTPSSKDTDSSDAENRTPKE